MSKKIHESGTARVQAHIERHSGRRVSVVLKGKAVLALEFLREERGLESDTAAINYALQRAAAENLSKK